VRVGFLDPGPAADDPRFCKPRAVAEPRSCGSPRRSISEQFFAEHHATPGSHPSYRHEEPASPNTCVTLLTGGFLVRIQAEEPSFQELSAIGFLHNSPDEMYGSRPDGCERFSVLLQRSIKIVLNEFQRLLR
jgi:hypothetical protein